MAKKDLTKQWTDYAEKRLVGRKIVSVRYLDSKECDKDFGWYKRPITFTLDDGKLVIAQMDDEGNDGGVLMIEYPGETTLIEDKQYQKTEILPVLRVEED